MTTIDMNKVLDRLGITDLNDMQQEARQVILGSRDDVVVLSPTGTGKTLAYLLPLIQLLESSRDDVQALVIVPGRELALQSDMVLKSMSCGLRSQSCYGGRTAMDEHRMLRQNRPQVVFGTPGRLNDHLDKGNINPQLIRIIVIDEFDKCLEMGFQDEMSQLLAKLPILERRILLSATDAEEIPRFVKMGHTRRLDYLVEEQPVSERVETYRVDCPNKDKLETLARLLLSFGQQQSIVFLNYRDSVERVDSYLRGLGFVTSAFHGGLEQLQREDALYKFSNGSATVLISTDLASRGLDIPRIDNIIHYHLPLNEEALIHRVGRTARWDATGRTFFLVGPEENGSKFEIHGSLYEGIGPDSSLSPVDTQTPPKPRMATVYIGKGKKDKISKADIVGFLCKIGGLKSCEIGRIDVKDRYAYVAIARPRLQMLLRNVQGEKIKGLRTIVEQVH